MSAEEACYFANVVVTESAASEGAPGIKRRCASKLSDCRPPRLEVVRVRELSGLEPEQGVRQVQGSASNQALLTDDASTPRTPRPLLSVKRLGDGTPSDFVKGGRDGSSRPPSRDVGLDGCSGRATPQGCQSTPREAELQERRPGRAKRRPTVNLTLESPLLAAPAPTWDGARTPGTPLPQAWEFKCITGSVAAILFDFDGTLTATPGEHAFRSQKHVEIRERAPLLAPRLKALRDAGICLGIISKSSELTIRCALSEAGLMELFDGPLVANAVGFEGKAGFIEELIRTGALPQLGPEGNSKVLLVDDDVRELVRARQCGIQTYAAPKDGGLQKADFDEIFCGLGLQMDGAAASQAPAGFGTSTIGSARGLVAAGGGSCLTTPRCSSPSVCHGAKRCVSSCSSSSSSRGLKASPSHHTRATLLPPCC